MITSTEFLLGLICGGVPLFVLGACIGHATPHPTPSRDSGSSQRENSNV